MFTVFKKQFIMIIAIIIALLIFIFIMKNTGVLKEEREDKKAYKEEIKKMTSELDLTYELQKKTLIKETEVMFTEYDLLTKITSLNNQNRFIESVKLCDTFLIKMPNNYNVLFAKAEAISLHGRNIEGVKYLNESLNILSDLESFNNNDNELFILFGNTFLGLTSAFAK